MMKNRHLSLISVVCLTSICFISLLWPAIAFSLTEDCVAEGTDGSLVQSGQEAFGTSGSDRLTLDSDNFKASIDSSIYEYTILSSISNTSLVNNITNYSFLHFH